MTRSNASLKCADILAPSSSECIDYQPIFIFAVSRKGEGELNKNTRFALFIMHLTGAADLRHRAGLLPGISIINDISKLRFQLSLSSLQIGYHTADPYD